MNQRQKKKRMAQALTLLNQADVVEFDCQGEDVIYIYSDDTPETVQWITQACGLLGLDKKKFLAECRADHLDERTLNLANGWFTLLEVEPKKYTIWFSLEKGFYLVRCLEEEV